MSSKINFRRRTFIEKEELNRFQDLLIKNSLKDVLVKGTNSYGIVANNSTRSNTLKVSKSPSDNKSIEISEGVALLQNGEVIRKEGGGVIGISDNPGNKPLWVFVSNKSVNYEVGTVNISSDGLISGTVDFSQVARGVQTKVPIYLKFEKYGLTNVDVYYITEIVGNNKVKVSNAYGGSIVEERDLKVIILGTLPIGGTFTEEQLEGLYTYDNFEVSFVNEEHSDTEPVGPDNSIVLARLTFSGDGTIASVTDKRKNFWYIESSTITTDRIEDGAVTPEKLSFATFKYDYEVNSDEKLAGLKDVGPDVKSVLIRKGNWTYNGDIKLPTTVELIEGESGAKINVWRIFYEQLDSSNPKRQLRNLHVNAIEGGSGEAAITFMSHISNVTVESAKANGISRSWKIENTKVVTATEAGFMGCAMLRQCTCTGVTKGFKNCHGVQFCNTGVGSRGYDNSFFDLKEEPQYACDNTLNGGFNT